MSCADVIGHFEQGVLKSSLKFWSLGPAGLTNAYFGAMMQIAQESDLSSLLRVGVLSASMATRS